jgi:hypothetical protein
MKLESTQPVPLDGTDSASLADISSNWAQMIQDIKVVDVLFKVISTPIRRNALVQDMYLSHTPGVKTRLREQILQKLVITHLNVADPKSEATDIGTWRNCSLIAVMENPPKGAWPIFD